MSNPRRAFVASFVGAVNLLDVVDDGGIARVAAVPALVVPVLPPDLTFCAVVRPEDVLLSRTADGSLGVAGEIVSRTYLGDHASYVVRVGPLTLRATTPKTLDIAPGVQITLRIRHASALPLVQRGEDGTEAASGASQMQGTARAVY